MCHIWTRCLRVLFRPPTLRPRKCLISHSLSEEREIENYGHYAAISENCLYKTYCLYKATCSPRHVESCYYFIFLMKIGTETYFKSSLSQPSSRGTLQLTRSNHKFQPNITFVCDVSARRLITMSSCNLICSLLSLFNLINNLLHCADDYVQFMK